MSLFDLFVLMAAAGWLLWQVFILLLPPADVATADDAGAEPTPPTSQRQMTQEQLRITCAHEAGHAICAWWCTLVQNVKSIRIAPNYGHTHVIYHGEMDSDNGRWCRLVILLAGIAAERMAGARVNPTESWKDMNDAYELAEKLAEKWPAEDPPWPVEQIETGTLPFQSMYCPPLPAEQAEVMMLAYRSAKTILLAHENQLRAITQILETDRALSSERLTTILGERSMMRVYGVLRYTFFPLWIRPPENIPSDV